MKKTNKIIVNLMLILIFINLIPNFCSTSLPLQSQGAVLIDSTSGQVLYDKNMNSKLYPASTTKIMTAILAIENKKLADTVVINENTPFEIEGTHIALEGGEILTIEQLLYAALLNSANDAALSLAKAVSGSEEKFVELMNQKASELGMLNTHFNNPHGLTDEEHYSSAYDLAILAQYALKNETFKKIIKEITYTIPPTNKKSESRNLHTTDRLLFAKNNNKYLINVNNQKRYTYYEGAIGIKNGYTSAAKNCNVAAATRNNTTLISVVLGAEGSSVWSDTHYLLDYGFSNFQSIKIANSNEYIDQLPVKNGDRPDVASIIPNDLFSLINRDDLNNIQREIVLSSVLEAPISKGTVVGQILFSLNGKEIANTPIVAATNVELVKELSTSSPINFWKVVIVVVSTLILILLFRGFYLFYDYKKGKKRRGF